MRRVPMSRASKWISLAVTIGSVAAWPATVAGQPPVIDIPPGGAATPRLAVSDCVPRGDAAREACENVTRVLRDDLRFEGLFGFVDADLPQEPSASAPDVVAWRARGADVLIATAVEVEGGRLGLDVAVWVLASRQAALEKRFTGSAANPRFFAHTLSDAVMSLTSYRGVARTQIAFVSNRDGDFRTKDVYVADYDGQRVQRLTRDRLTSILPEWSPDGSRLVYTFIGIGSSRVVAVPLERGAALSLCPEEIRCAAPEWSPDGRRIAYARTGPDGRSKIWVADADGGRSRQITDGPGADTAPSWSPTGGQIAFTSDRSGTPQIWIVGAEGLGLERITYEGGHNDGASWSRSPIFAEIAYTSQLGRDRLGIAVVEFGTGRVRRITSGSQRCEKPTWSPSGRHLMFACEREGRWQLAVSDRLGAEVRMLDAGPGSNSQPAWGPFRE